MPTGELLLEIKPPSDTWSPQTMQVTVTASSSDLWRARDLAGATPLTSRTVDQSNVDVGLAR